MKIALLSSLCILFSSCVYGITVPPDVVAIDISFAENTSQPVARPLKTITITVEEEGQTRATYSFTNQATDPSYRKMYQSARDKRVRISAQLSDSPTATFTEFLVDEYTGVNSYVIAFGISGSNVVVSCKTPTKACPVLP
jgi:hypothetical protein